MIAACSWRAMLRQVLVASPHGPLAALPLQLPICPCTCRQQTATGSFHAASTHASYRHPPPALTHGHLHVIIFHMHAVRALQLGLSSVPRVDPRAPRSLDEYCAIYREWLLLLRGRLQQQVRGQGHLKHNAVAAGCGR